MELRAAKAFGEQWRGGVLAITLTDVSSKEDAAVFQMGEAQFEFEVWDVGGNSVQLTDAGEKLRAHRNDHLTFCLACYSVYLHPGDHVTVALDLARLFQIKPGEIYTVRIRRSHGLPVRDQAGRKLLQELSRTYVITGHEDR